MRTDTNKLLKDLCEIAEQNDSAPMHVTLVAGGQIITGTIISEDQYFSLEDNAALREQFVRGVREPRQAILGKLDENPDTTFNEELKEYFLYLNTAFFIVGNNRFPPTTSGLSMQVRVSDVTAFSFIGLNGS
jgi:hypothetical protein